MRVVIDNTAEPPATDNEEWAVAQLAQIQEFLAVASAYGFGVTATPSGLAALRRSSNPAAARIMANVCRVAEDPRDPAKARWRWPWLRHA